jgi:hypothetical protein
VYSHCSLRHTSSCTEKHTWTTSQQWCACPGLLVSMFLTPGPVLLGIAAGLLAWNGAGSLATAVWSGHLGDCCHCTGFAREIRCCAATMQHQQHQQELLNSCLHGATGSGLSAVRLFDDCLRRIAGLLSTLFWTLSGAGGVVLSWRWASQPKHAVLAKLKAEDANGAVQAKCKPPCTISSSASAWQPVFTSELLLRCSCLWACVSDSHHTPTSPIWLGWHRQRR